MCVRGAWGCSGADPWTAGLQHLMEEMEPTGARRVGYGMPLPLRCLPIVLILSLIGPALAGAAGRRATPAATGGIHQYTQGRTATLQIGAARIDLLIANQPFVLKDRELRDWVMHSAEIVAHYFDGFPVPEVHVVILGGRGSRVMSGHTVAGAKAVVNVRIGLKATPQTLRDDWIMVHELIHLAFPSVPRRHHWVEEGLATYVESIARAQAGDLDPEAVWAGFVEGMPKGLARPGDRGLDHTPTWGRTYWGGALFFLTADLRIRQQTGGAFSLRDALRGMTAAGYNILKEAQLRDVWRTADAATGVDVLSRLYEEMRASPVPRRIEPLWQSLGITDQHGRIVFDDDAPLAVYRDALTSPAP